MQDFKHRRSTPRKPWLKRRFRLSLRRRDKASLPKGFRPLPVLPQAQRESTWQVPKVALVRPPLALLHGTIVLWLAVGVGWNGWQLLQAPLEKVRVSGNQKLTGGQVLSIAGLAPGVPMVDVDPIGITRLLRGEPAVAAVDVRRVYPAAVWIDLRERAPDLRVTVGEAQAVIDAKNVVIERGVPKAAAALPLVRGTRDIPAPGEVLADPGLQRAREFLRQMGEARLPVDQVTEIDTSHPYMLTVRLADGRRVLFSAEQMAAQLRLFQDLTQSPALGDALGGGTKVVDLRSAIAEDGRVVVRQ